MNILLGLELVILLKSVRSSTPKSEHFKVLNGLSVSSGQKTLVYNVYGRLHCARICLHANTSLSANFDTATHTCELTTEITTEETTFIVEEQNWEFLRPNLGDAWRLVYRAAAGIGVAVYDAWIGSFPFSTDNCTSTQPTNCLTHYRSSILDHWTTNNIKQVRFSLYKNDSMVVNIIFNNYADDENTRWFSKDRLVNSSYPDMTPASQYNYFSVTGFALRRFYISGAWSGCATDIGWITVYDGAGSCYFEKEIQFPYFGYSADNQKGKQPDFLSADVLAVFIKQG